MTDTTLNFGGGGWDNSGGGQQPEQGNHQYSQPPVASGEQHRYAGAPQQGYSQPPTNQYAQGYSQPPTGGAMGTMAASLLQAGGGGTPLGGAMGMAAAQFGEQQFNDMSGKVSKYVNMGQLKFYFQVNTQYVLSKLRLLLVPMHTGGQHDPWVRVEKEGKSLPPKDDLNAPDLYIPVMAFLTYVLSVGVALGSAGKWSPELIGTLLSQTIGWIAFEVFLCYAALWLMNVPSHPLLELTAFCSYKFVGMCFSLLAYIVTQNSSLYFGVLAWNSISTGTFLVQTIRHTSSDELDRQPEARQKALYVAIAMGVFQGLMMFWFTWGVISELSDDGNADKAQESKN